MKAVFQLRGGSYEPGAFTRAVSLTQKVLVPSGLSFLQGTQLLITPGAILAHNLEMPTQRLCYI